MTWLRVPDHLASPKAHTLNYTNEILSRSVHVCCHQRHKKLQLLVTPALFLLCYVRLLNYYLCYRVLEHRKTRTLASDINIRYISDYSSTVFYVTRHIWGRSSGGS